MSVRWYSVVVDCNDVSAQSRWWAQVLDWRAIHQDPREVVVVPPYVAGDGGGGTQEGLQRSHAIDERHDAIEASAAPVLRSPSSVRRPTFVE
jgi:hypothetical protein